MLGGKVLLESWAWHRQDPSHRADFAPISKEIARERREEWGVERGKNWRECGADSLIFNYTNIHNIERTLVPANEATENIERIGREMNATNSPLHCEM